MIDEIICWLNTPHGVWTGLVSAFTFLILVFLLFKPWFLISDEISELENEFRFKMVNITSFKCVDFNIFLRQVVVHELKKGCHNEFQMLEIKKNPFIYVPSVFGVFRESKPNCLQLTTEKNVRAVIEATGTYVELIIIAKHGLTGLQSTYKKRFKSPQCIIKGEFKPGFNFSVSNKTSS